MADDLAPSTFTDDDPPRKPKRRPRDDDEPEKPWTEKEYLASIRTYLIAIMWILIGFAAVSFITTLILLTRAPAPPSIFR